VKVSNSGTEAAERTVVCLKGPRAFGKVRGAACRTVNVAAKGSATIAFKFKTKKGKKGKAKFTAGVDYQSDGSPKKASGSRTTVLK
jgi:hypothetical protein